MPVLPEFQSALDELNATVASISALKASVDAVAGSPTPQDIADTVAAVQTTADAVKAAVGT